MNDYRTKHEPFFYCSLNKKKAFYGDRTNTTVLDIPASDEAAITWLRRQKEMEKFAQTTVWTMKRDPVNGYVHPTQKPVELIIYALTNSSKQDDIVLDLFGGSGSTIIACEKLQRRAFVSELGPKYVDVMVQRWVNYTGEEKILKNGKPIVWKATLVE